MKGLEIETIFIILITLISISLLFMFVSGPLQDLGKNVFCFFYQNVLQQKHELCEASGISIETKKISPSTREELARYIAAYSIACWQNAKFEKGEATMCFSIELEKNPGEITEYDITKIMEDEGGCKILENSIIKDINGNEISYSGNCGDEDQIYWDVYGNFIKDQKLITILYNKTENKIIIKA
jgi:hypothetical protein